MPRTPLDPDPGREPPARRRAGDGTPRPDRLVIGFATWLDRSIVLPHLARVTAIDLPAPDLARLRAALRPGAAAFLAPNHPEFLTDVALDKELSVRVSPHMAFWIANEVLDASALGRALLRRHTVVSNRTGSAGLDASVDWALSGRGVLMHPEGGSSWQGGRIGPLMRGIAALAARAIERSPGTPVLVVPIAWRLVFRGDVAPGLAREMRVIERALDLAPGDLLPVGERFAALMANLLARRRTALGMPGTVPAEGRAYFAAQRATQAGIARALEARGLAFETTLARLMRRVHRAGDGRERQLWLEAWRLAGFAPALYDRPALEPERIAETLKRTRTALVTRGWRNALHNVIPRPVGDRVAHVRVAEPVAAHEVVAAAGDPDAARERLLERLATRMQGALDGLAAELEPALAPRRVPNPLWSGEG